MVANSYSLDQALLQAIVDVLNEQPAGRVRGLINRIEAECSQQDELRRRQELEYVVRERMAEQGVPDGEGSEP